MIIEIVTDGRKNSLSHIIKSDSRKIELRACHRDKDIKQIIYKERSNQYKGHLFEPFEPINEIKQRHNQHHRIIEEISHIKRFADQNMRKRMAEPDSRLSTEDKLFDGSKDMVQVRKKAIEFKSIRIPIGKQAHLNDDTHKRRELTRGKPIKIHQQESHCSNHGSIQ